MKAFMLENSYFEKYISANIIDVTNDIKAEKKEGVKDDEEDRN